MADKEDTRCPGIFVGHLETQIISKLGHLVSLLFHSSADVKEHLEY